MLSLLRIFQLHDMILAGTLLNLCSCEASSSVSCKVKSTPWANYQCNAWLWVGSKKEGRWHHHCMQWPVISGKKQERKLQENRLSTSYSLNCIYCTVWGERVEDIFQCCFIEKWKRQMLLVIAGIPNHPKVFASDFNVSLNNLWESLSVECRHFSSLLIGFSWLSR